MSFHWFGKGFIMSIYSVSSLSGCAAIILSSFLCFFFFLSPISPHFVQFIVFYKTGPCRLKASDESPRRPEHQGQRILFKAGDRSLHSISKMCMRPFQVLCGTPAFSFGAHYSFFFFLLLDWFECSQKQGGSPHKVLYLFLPLISVFASSAKLYQCPWASWAKEDVCDAWAFVSLLHFLVLLFAVPVRF